MLGCVLLKYVPWELLELLFMYCQDVPSFGNAPVKMFHLSAGSNCDIWWYLLVHVWVCSVEVPCELLELLFMYCQDVPSFSRKQQLLYYVVVLFSTFLNLRVICSYSTSHIVFLLCIVKIFWREVIVPGRRGFVLGNLTSKYVRGEFTDRPQVV